MAADTTMEADRDRQVAQSWVGEQDADLDILGRCSNHGETPMTES